MGLQDLGKKSERQSFSFLRDKATFIHVHVSVITWLKYCLSAFSTVKLLFFLFLYCSLQKEVTMHSPHLRNEQLCFTSFQGIININHLEFFYIQSYSLPFAYLFNHLLISVQIHRYFFYIILLYLHRFIHSHLHQYLFYYTYVLVYFIYIYNYLFKYLHFVADKP